jgi:hypothetical protein
MYYDSANAPKNRTFNIPTQVTGDRHINPITYSIVMPG